MPVTNPSSAQWPQDSRAAFAPEMLGFELDTSEAQETYVLSDTPNVLITLVPVSADTVVINA